MRTTVVVGLVGAGGLGRLLGGQLASFDYRSLLTSLLFYVGLTFLVNILSPAVPRVVGSRPLLVPASLRLSSIE